MTQRNKCGSVVFIHYKGGVKGEEPLDDRSTGEPLAVMLGTLQLPKGLEDALCDMAVGEQRTVTVPSELGYGSYREKLASWYPKSMVDDGYTLQVGDVMFWTNPEDHRKMPAWVTEMTDDNVKIDFNHPFAGKTLEYWVELVDVK